MAKINMQVPGGDIKQYEASDISMLANMTGNLNKQASVNGEPVDHDYELSDYEFVVFSEKIKGA